MIFNRPPVTSTSPLNLSPFQLLRGNVEDPEDDLKFDEACAVRDSSCEWAPLIACLAGGGWGYQGSHFITAVEENVEVTHSNRIATHCVKRRWSERTSVSSRPGYFKLSRSSASDQAVEASTLVSYSFLRG